MPTTTGAKNPGTDEIEQISYEEIGGSPTFAASNNGITARQIYKMPWTSIDQFIRESFPPAVEANCEYIHENNRPFPGKPKLITDKITVEPWLPDKQTGSQEHTYDGVNTYSHARVTIDYATLPRQGTVPYGTHRITMGAEFIVLPKLKTQFVEDGNTVADTPTDADKTMDDDEVQITKVIPTIEHTLNFVSMPNPPFDKIREQLGTVNKDEGDSNLFSAEPGTLLFLGIEGEEGFNTEGETAWDISYRFSEKRIHGYNPGEGETIFGWNHFYNKQTGTWEVVIRPKDGGNGTVYDESLFTKLFTVFGCVHEDEQGYDHTA